MVRGPGEALAGSCQLVLFRPHASYLRKEARCRAAGKKLLVLRLPRNITQGSADPCAIPGGLVLYCLTGRASSTVFVSTLFLVCNCIPVCRIFNDQTAEQLIWRSFAAARHFCSAKILAGGLRWGWGPRRSREQQPPRKEISRGNLLCAKSGPTNLSYPRLPSTQKYVTTPDWSHVRVGQPRGARGTAVPLFREESRGTPSKGFLWATSSRRLDTALLFADKKRGVETTRLAGYYQSTPGACRHGRQQKAPRCRARQ